MLTHSLKLYDDSSIPSSRIRIVKNELGGSASNTAGTKGLGRHNGMNWGTGGKPPTPINSNPAIIIITFPMMHHRVGGCSPTASGKQPTSW